MSVVDRSFSRRGIFKTLGVMTGGVTLGRWLGSSAVAAQEPVQANAMEAFTGPSANPYWNSVGPYVAEPQKVPLILLTDRPVQLETPRHYFRTAFTPNEAFYVRWHLEGIPNAVDLKDWKLQIEGNVNNPLALSLPELMQKFKPVSLAAANQCSGNSRSRLQPRVPGGQWGNGAMGNAMWTGVRLRELLDLAGVKSGSLQVQFQGLETGQGPKGLGSNLFLKSLDLGNPCPGRMHRCVPDERRAASHAQWISGAAGRSRIFCNLLDQKSDVDPHSQLTGRKFLDEDRISDS